MNTMIEQKEDRAWVELDFNHLKHNVNELKKAMPEDCDLMAVVKAKAYGHGAFEVATHLNRLGVKAFAVATIDEGIELRRYGIHGEILILGFTSPDRAKELYKYDLIQTLICYNYALQLNKQGYAIKAHIKIDTGMHRLGFDNNDVEAIKKAFTMKQISICGIYTHLSVSDSLAKEDVCFSQLQIQRFYDLLEGLEKEGIEIPKTHIQSSYGLLNYPELKCNYVRAGISLYGALDSSTNKTRLQLDLRPVLSLKSRVVLLRQVKSGDSVGYGRSFIARRDSNIAILSIGYGDGVPRNLSGGNSNVIINGQRAPIIGQICMDQLIVDVTDIDHVSTGNIATLIGKDGNEEILATFVASEAKSIPNELLSRIGSRVK